MNTTACFPKSSRLLKSNEFNFSKKNSRLYKSFGFKLLYKKNESSRLSSRLGLAVSSKVGNAVKRNKIKRITREEFRKTSFTQNIDLLFIASKEVDILNLSSELKTLFNKLKGEQ